MIEKRVGVIMYQTSNSKGQELVAQRMVRDFTKLGKAAYLITSTYHDGSEIVSRQGLVKNKGYYCIDDEILRIPVIRVDSSLAKWPPRRIVFKDFINTLNNIVDDFGLNVLISHSTLWNGPEDAAKFVTWRRHMRNVGSYQDPIVFCHMSHFQEPSSQRYSIPELTYRTAWNKMALSKILEAANLTLVVTPFEKQAKLKMGARPEKCLLYPGGVDNEMFMKYAAEDPADFLKQFNLVPGTRIVSYLGTLEERKNPLAVVKIAERLRDRPDIRFVLAGKGEPEYVGEIIKAAGGLSNVSYLGEINDREKVLLIRSSYINILMSKLEALGITQLEFMYGGVPVVTSGVGGQSWIVQNGIEGLHAKGPGDIDGATNAVVRLIDDQNLYQSMSINAKQRAGKYASIYLTEELDSAINNEMLKESQLKSMPHDLQDTLTRSEYAVKSWSSGTSGVVATNRSVFITQGWISKRVLGMPYQNIKAIEYFRKFPWKVPLIGVFISCLAFLMPFYKSFLAPGVVAGFKELGDNINNLFPLQIGFGGPLYYLLSLLPLIISVIIFFWQSRTGFHLYGEGNKPIYLPVSFKKAIEFIRRVQDKEYDATPKKDLSAPTYFIPNQQTDSRYKS
jgi:D-inositol-3-phosphate glycosyltransferase